MHKTIPVLLFVILFLAACANAQPTPEPAQTATAVIAEVVVTDTAVSPTNTPSPSPTPTPTQTAQPTAIPTVTQTSLPEESVFVEKIGLDIVNQVGGVITAVSVQDNIAYLGVGPRLIMVDVSDPTKPQVINQSDVLPSIVRQVVLKDDLAYLALGEEGLWIFNIADPLMPQLMGSLKTTIPAGHFLLADNLAYVVSKRLLEERPQTEGQSLVIVDVEDPAQLKEIGMLPLPTQANKLALAGNHLYVAIYPGYYGFENTLWIVNVSNPELPVLVTAVPELASHDITVKGHQLISSEQGTLILTDIINPSNPIKMAQSSHLIDFGMEFLHLDQDIVWTFSGYGDVDGCAGDLYALNITDPDNIQIISKTRASCAINSITISNNKLYLAIDDSLEILDISDPTTPLYIGEWKTIPSIRQLAHGDDLYGLTESDHDIYIFDLDDPVDLQRSNIYHEHNSITSIAVNDRYLYLGTSLSRGIPILDVSDPNNVTKTAEFESTDFLPIAFYNLVVSDEYLYMQLDNVTGVLDISEPTNPKDLAVADETNLLYNELFVVEGNMIYAWVRTAWEHGLRVIDASQPTQLTVISFWNDELESHIRALISEPNYVYLVGEICDSDDPCPKQNLLRVVDVTDPYNLSVIATLSIPDEIESITLYEDSLVLAGEDIWLVNIENQAEPYISGFYPTPGNTKDVIVVNDLIYIADGAGGILVLRLKE